MVQNGLRHTERTAKTGDDATHGGNFHLCRGVAHQINVAIANSFTNRHPFAINGNARALPLKRLEMFFFKEAFEASLGVASLFANHAQSSSFGGFRDQPIKIGRIVGDKPHPSGVSGAIFGQTYDGLHQRDGFDRRPTSSARDSAGGSVGAYDAGGMQFFPTAACFGFQAQSTGIGSHAQKTRIERQLRARCFRLARQCGDQPGTLNDQVGLGERNLRGTPVGVEFEPPNFVDDALASCSTELVTKITGNDQGAVRRVEARLGFKYANTAAAARYRSSSVQTRGGTADNNYFTVFPARPGNIIYVCHRLIFPNRCGCLLMLQLEITIKVTALWSALRGITRQVGQDARCEYSENS